ncbi:hypothetical protein Ptr86124_006463 [Pyrenophora tritici-repentis]|uniref:Uncharacterized protein n=1 Tax=Pyrenophora tritici-repentis TaxID=45151 RepID=A0A922SZF3_9PLEO|nr:hypothetical protein Ptr86124_006463 [Pyrenophora tritici-repentis]
MDITSTQTFDIPPPPPPTFFSSDPSTFGTDAVTVTETSLIIVTLTHSSSGESAAATIYIPNIKTITLVTTISSNVGSITTPAIAPSSPTPVSPVVSSTSSSASASSSISTYIPTTALSFLTSHLSSPAITTSPLSSTSVVKPSIASNEPNQIGLSTSAKIGVAVGAVLGGFAIGLTAFCLGLRLHRRRKSAFDGDMTPVYGGNPEKDGNEVFRSEMNGTPMVQQTVAELETPTHDLIVSPLHTVDLRTEDKTHDTICEVDRTLSCTPTSIAQPSQDDPDSSRIREQDSSTHEDCDLVHSDGASSPCQLKEPYDDPQLIKNPWRESRILDD